MEGASRKQLHGSLPKSLFLNGRNVYRDPDYNLNHAIGTQYFSNLRTICMHVGCSKSSFLNLYPKNHDKDTLAFRKKALNGQNPFIEDLSQAARIVCRAINVLACLVV